MPRDTLTQEPRRTAGLQVRCRVTGTVHPLGSDTSSDRCPSHCQSESLHHPDSHLCSQTPPRLKPRAAPDTWPSPGHPVAAGVRDTCSPDVPSLSSTRSGVLVLPAEALTSTVEQPSAVRAPQFTHQPTRLGSRAALRLGW